MIYHFHLILRGCRLESSSAFNYIFSVSFNLKQFLKLWPSWPFEDYRLVILQNAFQFGLALMIRSRLYIIKRYIKVLTLVFSLYSIQLFRIFVCPVTYMFVLLLNQSCVYQNSWCKHTTCIPPLVLHDYSKDSFQILQVYYTISTLGLNKCFMRQYFQSTYMNKLISSSIHLYLYGLMISYFIQWILIHYYHFFFYLADQDFLAYLLLSCSSPGNRHFSEGLSFSFSRWYLKSGSSFSIIPVETGVSLL